MPQQFYPPPLVDETLRHPTMVAATRIGSTPTHAEKKKPWRGRSFYGSGPLCSPKSGMRWLRSRSLFVGGTSFCYAASYPWGGWSLWLLQVFTSFMSDFVFTGRDSYFHVVDRTLASFQAIYFVSFAFATTVRWYELVGVAFTFLGYFVSVRGIKRKNYIMYQIGHTCWHLGSLTLISVLSRNCDFSWSSECQARWVLYVYCDCATSGMPYVMLPLFALSILYCFYKVMQPNMAMTYSAMARPDEIDAALTLQRTFRACLARRLVQGGANRLCLV